MNAALAVRDLHVSLGGRDVLTDVTLDVAPGEWLGIVGPNGAGKSTLLHAVCGLVTWRGSVSVDGRAVDSLDRRTRARALALVPQTPAVPHGMTVTDYVLLGRTPHRRALAAESRHDLDVVREALDALDRLDLARRGLATLSGGERQRAFLARAVAQESRVVLLDEPTSALDIRHQVEVLDLIARMRRERGLTVITTLHDLTLASRYPDRLVMLATGRVVAHGAPRDVLTEQTIGTHYGARVRVLHHDDGIVVVPLGVAPASPDALAAATEGTAAEVGP